MISIYSIKPLFQRALKPLLLLLMRIGATPNQITVLTTAFSIGFGVYFSWAGSSSWHLMPIVFFARMAFNALDGLLACRLQMQSRLGVYLNEMGDMLSDLFLYLPFALHFPWTMGSVIALSLFSEVAGIMAVLVGGERRYDGPLGKSDRAFCLGIIGFLMSFGWVNGVWAVGLFSCMALLLGATIFFRIRNGLRRP